MAVVPELRDLRPQAGSEVRTVPLVDQRYDLDGLLDAVTRRTKLVYICNPNNPTGTMNTTDELDDFFARVPGHVLTVVDQAYFEYIDRPDYPDAVERYLRARRRVAVLRTFSKIYGLAGLRIGYAVAAPDVCGAMAKVRRPFDIVSPAQAAAVESIDAIDELARRRAANAEGLVRLESVLRAPRSRPGPVRRQLPLRRDGRRGDRALRPTAARRDCRAASCRLWCADRGAHHRRHPGRDRRAGDGARPRARARVTSAAPAASARHHRLAVLHGVEFRRLFLANLTSGIGTWLALLALQIEVYDRTHSGWWVGALLAANIVPAIAVGLLLGPLVDRLSRKGLMIVSDLGRMAVFAALPFVHNTQAQPVIAALADARTTAKPPRSHPPRECAAKHPGHRAARDCLRRAVPAL